MLVRASAKAQNRKYLACVPARLLDCTILPVKMPHENRCGATGEDQVSGSLELVRGDSQTLFDALLPVGAAIAVITSKRTHIIVGIGLQSRSSVGDLDGGMGWIGRSQFHIDGGYYHVVDKSDVLHPSAGKIEERIDPNAGVLAVLDPEYGSFGVLRRLRIEEFRIPVLASPAALGFRAKERGQASNRGSDVEMKSVGDMDQFSGRIGRLKRLWGVHNENSQGKDYHVQCDLRSFK